MIFTAIGPGGPIHDLGANQGALELGSVSAATGSKALGVTSSQRNGRLVVSTQFGMQLTQTGSLSFGTATVRAYLLYPDNSTALSLDGTKLKIAPQIILRNAAFGVVTQHRVEWEVSPDAPAGQISNQIGIEIITN